MKTIVYSKKYNTLAIVQKNEAGPNDWFKFFLDIKGNVKIVDVSDIFFVGYL